MRIAVFPIAGLLFMLFPLSAAQTEPMPAVSAQTADQKAFDKQIETIKQAMMGDPNIALVEADKAVAMASEFPEDKQGKINRATALWLQGEAYNFLNQPDKAQPIIAQALKNVEQSAPDTKLHGDLLRANGAIAAMSGKMDQALKTFLKAHKIFQKAGVKRSEAIVLQDIGQIYFDARDYQRVLKYYSQAVEAFDEDPWLNLTTYNNRAQVYREQKQFDEAVTEYLLALEAAEKLGSPMLQARILTNLANTQVKAGKLDAATVRIDQAEKMVRNSEAAGWRPFVTGVRAEIAAARGQYVLAASYIEQTFKGIDLGKSELPFREFHAIASDIYEKLGDKGNALAHLKAFQRLDSQASELTASTSSQLMEARFDFANQNLRISRLKQGQLERDILIEKQRTDFRTRVFIGVGTALSIIFALLLFGFFSIRKSRNEVRVANKNLTLVNTDLEKALRAKTEFLATTSHEIRTPLNGILGMAQVLLYDKKIAPDARERIEAVQDAGQSMKALVDDILDVAKMETGDITLDTCDTKLSSLLGDTLTLWHENARAKGLVFELSADAVPDNVRIDGPRVKQILSNLLSNALKFTDEGTVGLSIQSKFKGDQEHLVFEVKDSGCGIPQAQFDEIFEPFTQVNGSMTRQHGGTGLGLSICKRLADAMKGEVVVNSVEGDGSVFTLSIPITRLNNDLFAFDVENIGAIQSLKQASLLLIDKNEKHHALLRTKMATEMKSIEIVSSPEAALSLFKDQHFDHVIVEGSSVGDANPVESIRNIVEQLRQTGCAVTLLAAPSDALSLTEMTNVHADQVIVKPISLPDLMQSLRDYYTGNGGNLAESNSTTSFRKAG